jgi:flagellar motility protein MotE (MotC chaperone)
MSREEQIISERKRKLHELRKSGINPYPDKFDAEDFSDEIKEKNKLPNLKGVFVAKVVEDGSADKAGLKDGDVILKIGNKEVNSVASLQEEIGKRRPGDKVSITIRQKDGDEVIKELVLRNKEGETSLVSKEEIKKNHEATKKQTSQKMYERFADKFPDVKGEMIPEEVWNAVKGGDDLVAAYTDYIKDTELKTKEQELANLKTKLAELEGKQKSLEHKEQVKKKAVVKSTTGQGQASEEFDDFLQGLWGK